MQNIVSELVVVDDEVIITWCGKLNENQFFVLDESGTGNWLSKHAYDEDVSDDDSWVGFITSKEALMLLEAINRIDFEDVTKTSSIIGPKWYARAINTTIEKVRKNIEVGNRYCSMEIL